MKTLGELKKDLRRKKSLGERISLRLHWLVSDITSIPQEIKWFIQRGRRGYADCDTWSLDSYLLSWLPEAIGQIKKATMANPAGITYKEWIAILNKMINGFKAGRKLEDYNNWGVKEYQSLMGKLQESLKLFAKYFIHLWD